VCEAAAVVGIAQAGIGVMSAANEYNAEQEAVGAANRAKLKRAEIQDKQYLTDAMFDNAQYKNDMAVADVQFDNIYQAMMDQWIETDKQLDEIFAKGNYKVEQAIQKMYENDYAGTMTGNTAARLAGKSAREAGYENSQILHGLMMAEKHAIIDEDSARNDALRKQYELYDNVRFAPIHGHSPYRDFELQRGPSKASAYLSMASSVVGGAETYLSLQPKKVTRNPPPPPPPGGEERTGRNPWSTGSWYA